MPSSKRRPGLVMLVAGALVTLVVALVVVLAPRRSPPMDRVRPVPLAVAAAVADVAAGKTLATIGSSLLSTPEAANDVVFLTVAAAYGRCEPRHAHELGAMAARARLPVLAGLTSVLGPHSGSRAAWLAGISELAARWPCDGPVDVSIGPFHQRVTIQAYAASFPDSFFDPSLQSVSDEFSGRSLAERAVDPCDGVAYAVLPLDAPRAWQCSALRAQARRHVAMLCGGAADVAAQQIRDVVMRLPSTCQ